MMKYKILFTLFSIVSSVDLIAQQAYTLKQATDYALSHSMQKENLAIDLLKDDQKIKEYKSSGLPQLSAQGDVKHFLNIPTTLLPDFISPSVYGVLMQEGVIPPAPIVTSNALPVQFGTRNDVGVSTTLSQLIFSGSYLVALEASKELKNLTGTEKIKIERDIRRDVAKSYLTALLVKENKIILEKNIALLERSIFETKEYYKNGFIEKLDIDKLQLTLNMLLTQLQNLDQQYNMTLNVLKFAMGMDLKTPISLSDSFDSFKNENKTYINQSDLRYEFKKLDVSRKLTELNIKRFRMEKYPTVAAFLNAGVNRQSNKFDYFSFKNRWYPTTLVGLNINMKLYDSGMRKAQSEQANLDLKKIQVAEKMIADGISLEITKAKTDIQNAENNLKNIENNLKLAEDIYNKTKIKYKEGVGSSIEVTQAESYVFEIQASYINTLYQWMLATIDLKYAYGLYDQETTSY